MSVNIVINEKQPNLLLCSDYEKKEAVDRQRRLRLCQVTFLYTTRNQFYERSLIEMSKRCENKAKK